MIDLEQFDFGYPMFPPSILLVGDESSHTLKLKRKLERNGLRVYRTDVRADELSKTHQKYFELIVFDVQKIDLNSCEVCQKIKTDPELADIPLVILITCNLTQESLKHLDVGSATSCLVEDRFAEEKLIRIIEQTHYMTYRYM